MALRIEDVAGQTDAELDQKLVELARRPFDLETGPLFRVHLLSRGASEHIVLLVVHHIIADFWSTAVLVDDLGKAYAEERSGRVSELPAAADPRYADFARWQHGMVAGEEGRAALGLLAAAARRAAARSRPPDRFRQAGRTELPGARSSISILIRH